MTDSLALWLNIFSQAIIVFLLTQLSLGIFWLISKNAIVRLHHSWQYILLWLFVLLPWLSSLTCFILIEQNHYLENPSNIIQEYFHWHHSYSFNWNSWHGLSLMITLLIGSLLLLKAIRIAKNHYKKDMKRRILLNLTATQEGYFQHEQALAFTSGLIKPQFYISTALAKKLSHSELAMVRLHEQSHVDHCDPLQKWLFLFLVSFYPKFMTRDLTNSIILVMEYRADQLITKHFEVLDIAETFISMTRIMKSSSKQLEQRLHYLISPNDIHWAIKHAYPLSLIVIQVLFPIITLVFSMDFLHHQLDQWLWH